MVWKIKINDGGEPGPQTLSRLALSGGPLPPASSFHPPVAPLQLQDAGTEVPRANKSWVGGWVKKEVDGTAAAVGAGVAEPSRRSQRLRARRRQAVVSRFPVGAKARWPRRCRSGALGRSQVPSACAVDDKKVLPVPLLRLLPRSCPIGCFSSVTGTLSLSVPVGDTVGAAAVSGARPVLARAPRSPSAISPRGRSGDRL